MVCLFVYQLIDIAPNLGHTRARGVHPPGVCRVPNGAHMQTKWIEASGDDQWAIREGSQGALCLLSLYCRLGIAAEQIPLGAISQDGGVISCSNFII